MSCNSDHPNGTVRECRTPGGVTVTVCERTLDPPAIAAGWHDGRPLVVADPSVTEAQLAHVLLGIDFAIAVDPAAAGSRAGALGRPPAADAAGP